MSVSCCVRNLLHAASATFADERTFLLPAQYVEVGELVAAAGRHGGRSDPQALVNWEPDPWVQFNFGSYPPIQLPRAEAAGFRADATLDALVADSLR
jgi:hypothetical protein